MIHKMFHPWTELNCSWVLTGVFVQQLYESGTNKKRARSSLCSSQWWRQRRTREIDRAADFSMAAVPTCKRKAKINVTAASAILPQDEPGEHTEYTISCVNLVRVERHRLGIGNGVNTISPSFPC
ncbi:hypothetical protein TRVL_02141 [Trypanosoma vivax]|nr:hypothetical protein TRVL_02141 [Trypanosoma vivax]